MNQLKCKCNYIILNFNEDYKELKIFTSDELCSLIQVESSENLNILINNTPQILENPNFLANCCYKPLECNNCKLEIGINLKSINHNLVNVLKEGFYLFKDNINVLNPLEVVQVDLSNNEHNMSKNDVELEENYWVSKEDLDQVADNLNYIRDICSILKNKVITSIERMEDLDKKINKLI